MNLLLKGAKSMNLLLSPIETIPQNHDNQAEIQVMHSSEFDIKVDYCMIVKGDSMINARINDGDAVFFHSQQQVKNGEIAAVLIGEEVILKRVYYYPERKLLILKSENPKYKDLVYADEQLDEITIIGKAVAFQSIIV